LTGVRLHHRDTTFEITVDFVDHAVIVHTADGRARSFELGNGLPVADFDPRLHATLAELGIDVQIKEEPFGVPMTTPFRQDAQHASWDREAVTRFWPGDDRVGDAAYYSYTAPEPDGLRDQPLSAGAWIESGAGSLAILPYEAVRTARDPRSILLAFCQSAYEAGARLAGWDTNSFTSTWCPTPGQLRELHASAAAEVGRDRGRV
jgi:Family of unknown function (DUF5996)